MNKSHIKGGIVCHHDTALTKCKKLRQNLCDQFCSLDHAVIDAGQLLDLIRNRSLRINKNAVAVHDRLIDNLHGTDLDDLIILCPDTGCLQIEYNKRITEALPSVIGYCLDQVIDQICLHTIDHLQIIIRL